MTNTPYDPNLKITDIKIYRFDIPLKDVFQIATMTLSQANNVLVQILTSDGIRGWGEAASFHALVGETQLINFAAAQELKQVLLGRNPLEIASLVQALFALSKTVWGCPVLRFVSPGTASVQSCRRTSSFRNS